ncbi:unnamed protein product [Cylindrotheca closterium]|uniref:Uncharacterized protein n=1 Tax=Cylindrotheca closterium TaxID=2856 RepID=A0AAD2G469_9STRA|nr:unnamed protein product [Cylindrotheca closterium]
MPDRDEQQHNYYDRYLNAEVLLARGDKMVTRKVTGQKREADGSLRGTGHAVPMLDTRMYTVEFSDGAKATYAANVLAEGMYLQCDENGNQFLLLDSIIDHKTDKTAIQPGNDRFQYHGRLVQKCTTKGWQLCVQWKDGTTTWEQLSDLKESFQSEVAEYSWFSVLADIRQATGLSSSKPIDNFVAHKANIANQPCQHATHQVVMQRHRP